MFTANSAVVAVLLVAVAAPLAVRGGPLASLWTTCPKAGPDLNGCLVKSLQKFLPALKNGIPQISVPALDPAVLPEVDYSSGEIKLVAKNCKLSKLFTDFTVTSVDADLGNNKVKFSLKVPEITDEGQYDINGKVKVMPVTGSGTYKVVYKDVLVDVTTTSKLVTRDGKEYLDPQDVDVQITPAKAVMDADNLFNGNKELGDNFLKFANENWEELYANMRGPLGKALGAHLKDAFGKLLAATPFNELLS